MPARSTIEGCGYKTRVILIPETTDGYAIRLNDYCSIKDLSIANPTSISLSETVGTRHGIMYQGTYNADDGQGGKYMQLSNIYITGFSGGGITCYNTGYSTSSSINATNIHISNCNAGINISY